MNPMKKSALLFIAAALSLGACKQSNDGKNPTNLIDNPATASDPNAQGPTAKIEFEAPEYDFKTIVDGEEIGHSFTFKNTGEADLLISNVQATCGCTVPDDWPKHPIKPGESGSIRVTFNSKGKASNGQMIAKEIMVTANTNPPVTVLKLKGIVKEQQ